MASLEEDLYDLVADLVEASALGKPLMPILRTAANLGDSEGYARGCADERAAILSAARAELADLRQQEVGPKKADYWRGYINGFAALAGEIDYRNHEEAIRALAQRTQGDKP